MTGVAVIGAVGRGVAVVTSDRAGVGDQTGTGVPVGGAKVESGVAGVIVAVPESQATASRTIMLAIVNNRDEPRLGISLPQFDRAMEVQYNSADRGCQSKHFQPFPRTQ